jgi:hypothetical protein
MAVSFTEMEKIREERISVFLVKNPENQTEHVKIEIPVTHSIGDTKWVPEYFPLV